MEAPEERYGIEMIKIEVKEGLLPWVVGIGAVFAGILLIFVTAAYPDDSTSVMLGAYLIIFCMIGAGIFLCMNAKNRKMIVEDTSLCYMNCFGKKKNFSLEEICYCKAAFENGGSKDYIKLYDFNNKKLCKLEFNMKNAGEFLTYLLDNQIKVECTGKTEEKLKDVINAEALCPEEIPETVNGVLEEAKNLAEKWVKENKKFGVEWKMGIAVYLYENFSWKKQIWEQEGYEEALSSTNLPEGYLIGIEGYLQKDGQFVVDKKNQAVAFFSQLISVSKSYRIGEETTVHFWGNIVLEKISEELAYWTDRLPRKRYHTEQLVLRHELKEKI